MEYQPLSSTPPLERPPQSEQLTQEQIDMQYYKMAATFEIFKKYNVSGSLYAGTLLGAVRHQGIIPWDDDADITIHNSDYFIFEKLENELPPCFYFSRYEQCDGKHFYQLQHYAWYQQEPKPFYVDIFVQYDDDDNLCRTKMYQMNKYVFPKNWTLNMTSLKMGPYEFPAISDWRRVLHQTYGDDCLRNVYKVTHFDSHLKPPTPSDATVQGLVPSHKINFPTFVQTHSRENNKQYWDNVYLRNIVTDKASSFASWVYDTIQTQKYLNIRDGVSLLDLGCGNGRDTMFWSTHCKSVGIDQSIEPCIVNQNLSFKQMQAQDVKEDLSADILYLRFFVHAITAEAWADVIYNMGLHAKQGSLLCIEARTWADPMIMAGTRISRTENITDHYRRYQDKEELKQQLQLIGYELVQFVQGFGLSPYNGEDPHLLRAIFIKRQDVVPKNTQNILKQFQHIVSNIKQTHRRNVFQDKSMFEQRDSSAQRTDGYLTKATPVYTKTNRNVSGFALLVTFFVIIKFLVK